MTSRHVWNINGKNRIKNRGNQFLKERGEQSEEIIKNVKMVTKYVRSEKEDK